MGRPIRVAGEKGIVCLLAAGILATAVSVSGRCEVYDSKQTSLDNGCGPISAFVACRWVGERRTLSGVIEACHWKEGEPVSVRKVYEGLKALGVSSEICRLRGDSLRRVLSNSDIAVILLVRNKEGEVSHLATAVGVTQDKLVVVDYPTVRRDVTPEQLGGQWRGESIVVGRAGADVVRLCPAGSIYSTSRTKGAVFLILSVCAMAAAAGIVLWIRRRGDCGVIPVAREVQANSNDQRDEPPESAGR